MAVEFEKALIAIFLKAKNYVGYQLNPRGRILTKPVYSDDGKIVGEERDLLLRGVAPARRDHTQFENKLLLRLYRFILDRYIDKANWLKTFREVVTMITEYCQDFVDGKVEYEQFSYMRKVGDKYGYFVKNFADRLRAESGKDISPLERLRYVLVENTNAVKTVDRMMLLEKAIETKAKLDVIYYFESIRNQVEHLINVCFKEEIAICDGFYYKPQRSKVCKLSELIKIFCQIYKAEGNIRSFLPAFNTFFIPHIRYDEDE